jgi:RsiG-like
VIAVDESSFERLVNIQSYSDAELRTLAESLADQEAEVSKQRRLLQGELDIVRAELVRRLRDKNGSEQGLVVDGDVATLSKILAKKGPSAEKADK